jgi:hypothetical protein
MKFIVAASCQGKIDEGYTRFRKIFFQKKKGENSAAAKFLNHYY